MQQNPFGSDLEIRFCTKDDLQEIIEIVNENKSIYGIDIKTSGIQDFHIKGIKLFFETPIEEVKIVGCFVKKKLISFSLMRFWEAMPVWAASMMYSRLDKFDKKNNELLLILGTKKMIEYAESKNVYNFYMVTRYSNIRKRWNLIMSENFPEYTVAEVEILEPFEKSKWKVFQSMLGPINGKQEKSLVVLNCLKAYNK